MSVVSTIKKYQEDCTITFEAPLPKSFEPLGADTHDNVCTTSPFLGEVIIGQRFGLRYRDQYGEVTMRHVTIRRLRVMDKEENCYIVAFCHLRKAPRTFRIANILYLVCPETGEIEESPYLFLRNYGLQQLSFGKGSPVEENELLSVIMNELHLLAYLAACDGHFHELEQEIMLEYVMARLPYNSFDIEEMTRLIKRIQPDIAAFNTAIRQLRKLSNTSRTLLFRYAQKLVNADAILSAPEFEAIMAIESIDL